MILVCWTGALVFPSLILMGGTMQPVTLLWQPALVGALFLAGQLFTLLAVARGDVSIAAPVLGVKVLVVPALSPLFVDDALSPRIWIAAAIAMARLLTSPACVARVGPRRPASSAPLLSLSQRRE